MTIWRMCIACWIPEEEHTHTHTHTHSEYVILTVFPIKNGLHAHALHVHCCSLKHTVLCCGHSTLLEGCRAKPDLASRNW
jgi:hypothetical protein